MEESTYKRLTEKLDKLKRNETQMSDQQKTEYASYWCKHCTPYTGTSYNGKPLTFWNDIIEMGWR